MSLESLSHRAQKIRLLLMDCDGVLTDGSLLYLSDGERVFSESKIFHIHDGLAIKLARAAGIKTGIISGRNSYALTLRARELKVDYIFQGNDDKLDIYEQILQSESLIHKQAAYIGDDLHDLPVLKRVGLAIAPADAVSEVREAVHLITTRNSGRGVAREAVEYILKEQNKWSHVTQQFFL
jgi:3-deoxy-D-manno-octulosonate 8-phosphate phosphatase (KDO 8-P phosphatase)